MATPEEQKRAEDLLKKQKELKFIEQERLRIERERLGLTASDSYLSDSLDQAKSLTSFSRQLTEDLKEQVGMRRGIGEENRKLVSLARQLQDSASQVTAEIGAEAAVSKQLAKDREIQRNIQLELEKAQAELTDLQATKASKLAGLDRERANIANDILIAKRKAEGFEKQVINLRKSNLKTDLEDADILAEKAKRFKNEVDTLEEKRKSVDLIFENEKRSVDAATDKVATLENQFGIATDLVGIREAELDTQRKITQAMGVTGAVVTGLGGIMQRLGLRSGIFNQTVEDTAEAMRKVAAETEKANGEVNRLETMMVGIKTLINGTEDGVGGLKRALGDPATISLAILDAFFKIDQAAADLQQKIGVNTSEFVNQNDALATSVQQMELMSDLADKTGRNVAAIFTSQQIGEAAELTNTLGLSADQAGELAIIAQEAGRSVGETADNVFEQVDAFNKVNRTAISGQAVLRDIGDASFDIKASFLAFPDGIAEAATAAKRLGMNLDDVNNIADSLMDFESSIQAELEAQLLTGKQINMAKAREFALSNDLAGLSNEIFKNSVEVAEYGEMNRIQQQALAKSMGITTEQLAKMAYQRGLDTKMTDEQLKSATGLTREEYERMSAQDAMATAMAKLAQAFAPILDIVGTLANTIAPLVGVLGKIVGFVIGLPGGIGKITIAAIIAAKAFGGIGNAIGAAGKGIGSLAKGVVNIGKNAMSAGKYLLGMVTSPGKKLKELQAGFKKFGSMLKEGYSGTGAKDPTKKLTDASKKVSKDTSTGAKGTSSLTNTIQKIDAKKLLAGAAAMVIAAGAVFIFAKATQEFMEVSWSAVGKAVVGLAALVLAVGAVGAIMMSGVGAVAILAGAAAMVVMAGALYVLGKAMQLFNDVNYEGIGQLGASFISLGAGLAALGFSILAAVPAIAILGTLALLGPGLALAGMGIERMAQGVGALASALKELETEKLENLSDFTVKAAVAGVAASGIGALGEMVSNLTGGGDSENQELLNKVDTLIAAVEQDRVTKVYMNGNQLSMQMVQENPRQG